MIVLSNRWENNRILFVNKKSIIEGNNLKGLKKILKDLSFLIYQMKETNIYYKVFRSYCYSITIYIFILI